MSCDIHGYLDYTENYEIEIEKGKKEKKHFTCNFAELSIGRDYNLFTILAGVRDCDFGAKMLFAPKGIPEEVSFVVEHANTMFVSDDESYVGDGVISRKNAEACISHGSSKYVNEQKSRVSHPDWHSHSWLNLSEVKKVISVLKKDKSPSFGVMNAVYGSMKALKEAGYEPTFVFWFDN